jgi:hypothetical protein
MRFVRWNESASVELKWMTCEHCRKLTKDLKYASVRKWCSEGCRSRARRKRAQSTFVAWRRKPLPARVPDLEGLLLDLAPYGSLCYRLSCPGLGNGSPHYFPASEGWRLRPFHAPAVPWSGLYTVLFYDEDGQLLGEAAEVPVVRGRQHTPIGSSDHRRELTKHDEGPAPDRGGPKSGSGANRRSSESRVNDAQVSTLDHSSPDDKTAPKSGPMATPCQLESDPAREAQERTGPARRHVRTDPRRRSIPRDVLPRRRCPPENKSTSDLRARRGCPVPLGITARSRSTSGERFQTRPCTDAHHREPSLGARAKVGDLMTHRGTFNRVLHGNTPPGSTASSRAAPAARHRATASPTPRFAKLRPCPRQRGASPPARVPGSAVQPALQRAP